MESMEVIITIALIVSHFIAFLAGKSIKSNKAIDRAYPDYKELKEAEIERQRLSKYFIEYEEE